MDNLLDAKTLPRRAVARMGLDMRALAKLEQSVEQAAVAQVKPRMFSQALADIRMEWRKASNEKCALEKINVALNGLVVDAEVCAACE
jgi:predicted HAD superfamily Cof-like phosphohydrolase